MSCFILHQCRLFAKTREAVPELPGKGASDEMKILTVCNRGETTRLHFLHPSRFLLKYLQRRNRSTECVKVVQNIAIFDFLFSPEIRRTFLSFLSSNEFSWASVI